jgi:hypothetical protein
VTIKRRPNATVNKDLDVQEKEFKTQLTTVKKVRPAAAIDACRASIQSMQNLSSTTKKFNP